MMDGLPEECLSKILSLTSPEEACRLSLLSSTFRSAADSDAVWRKFLPHTADDIAARLVDTEPFSSIKELFVCLCQRPLLFDSGRKLSVERSTGKIIYMMSPRELSITWGDDPMYWSWKSVPKSRTFLEAIRWWLLLITLRGSFPRRFAEVVELRFISWLEIEAKIGAEALSPCTLYTAYLVLNVTNRAHGLDSVPAVTWVEVDGTRVSTGNALIEDGGSGKGRRGAAEVGGGWRVPVRREEDDWMEIELGEFLTGGDNVGFEVRTGLKEVKGCQLKGGIIVEGIEVRPKMLRH